MVGGITFIENFWDDDSLFTKKIKGDWKIISKIAASESSNKKGNRILFITSNTDYYGSSDIATGNSSSENSQRL